MEYQIQKIASYCGLKLKKNTLLNDDFNSSIIEMIRQMEVEPDDVILVYFSGHGYRSKNIHENLWPNYHIPSENVAINQLDLTLLLKEKEPRLLLSIADTCNLVVPDNFRYRMVIKNLPRSKSNAQTIKENYLQLFVASKGVIIASSAVPGTSANALINGGSLYTLCLLEKIDGAVQNEELPPTWDSIFNQISSDRHLLQFQTPQYQILE